MTESVRLIKAAHLPPDDVKRFLQQAFGEARGEFIVEHHEWHYHGLDELTFAVIEDNTLAGFNALIPSKYWYRGEVIPCLWWVDLIVLPEFRGRGLQRTMDEAILNSGVTLLGFPNELSSKILPKHGWGLDFGKGHRMIFPLSPRVDDRIRLSEKPTARMIRGVTKAFKPLVSAGLQLRHGQYQPQFTQQLDSPDFEQFARIFERYQQALDLMTTYRSADYLQWRFGDAPFECQYYISGTDGDEQVVFVTRIVNHKGLYTLRIMDIFGAITNHDLVEDGVRTIIRDAVQIPVEQVQLMASYPPHIDLFETMGFWKRIRVNYCWYASDGRDMQILEDAPVYWTYMDSDLDVS